MRRQSGEVLIPFFYLLYILGTDCAGAHGLLVILPCPSVQFVPIFCLGLEGSGQCPAVFAGRVSHVFLEQAVEVLGVLEAQFVGYLTDRLVRAGYHLFGEVDDFVLYVFLGRLTRLFLDEVAEVVGREADLVGKIADGGQAVFLRQMVQKVAVQQVFKLVEDVLVDGRAGVELAFVEAQAVVQQEFDVAHDEPFAMAVGRSLHLHTYLVQAVVEDAFFRFRQVERFPGAVGEEGVVPDFASQCRAADEVGMKQYSLCLRAFFHLHLDYLSRREAGHRAFLVVVGLAAITDVAATGLFQEQGVDAIVHGDVRGETGSLFQVDDADERMQALQVEHPVVCFYVIQFDYFFHVFCKSGVDMQK